MNQKIQRPPADPENDSWSELDELIRRSRNGDLSAMESIFEQYKQRLFSLIYRYTYNREVAEDLLQDTFIKIFTKMKNLKRTDTFVGWMYRIAINTSLSYLRGKHSRLQEGIPLHEIEGMMKGETSSTREKLLNQPLEEAIQTLSGKMKSVFLLHDVQGFKHEEIAKMLECSVGTSKSQLFKARVKLRSYLEKKMVI
ncbi:MAG: RNA polymerase sigma factor [Candidatus Aminicenantes bacterium]|nr:RNA polymerase sigma factor [Candidatus Aminicenantes bacterium]